ncbi:amidohydrolase family protein [Photobacterium sp.]|uniref:amidohydrolase family protein n=1 Tax=Photobacterium sp. TaxID=660 RepID=UPI00299F1B55|nr:amidohydrolase family protein [Photobacterium sp.]MDX1301035.1 amidohydrolase family protein [Photobacterium sp.]
MNNLLIKNVRPFGKESSDILILDGKIEKIAPSITAVTPATVVDGGGKLALPGFIDGHAHIDKSLWGMDWYANDVPSDLEGIITNERNFRAENPFSPQEQSERVCRQAISKGTTHIRTHIDVDTEIGLKHIQGVLETKEKLKNQIFIETVAFPQSGMLGRPGTVNLMEESLIMGADLIGGIDPSSFERNPVEHINTLFLLAAKHGKGVDIHLHEPGTLGAFSVELIIEKTKEYQLNGNVTISHAFCLGEVDADYQARLVDGLATQQIHIATTAPANRNLPPYEMLKAAGVKVTVGNDGIRDTWSPYGNADMLQRAMLMGLKYRWRKDRDLEQALYAITQGGADVLGLTNYGLKKGVEADLVLLEGQVAIQPIIDQPVDRTVIKAGMVVAENGVCTF